MSRYLPNEVFELDPAPRDEKPERRAAWLDLRGWLFLGMGLAGILTVALIVTADESYAGIDGMRAVRALVPQNEADRPDIKNIPFLGGIISGIRDIAPAFLGSAPSDPVAVLAPGTASPQPANSPSSSANPTPPGVPAVQQPSSATPPPASTAAPSPSTPTVSPVPSSSPSAPVPPATTTPPPSATPSPTPAPTLAISTDRGATAIVNLADLVPGDSMTRTITVQNSGNLAFRYTVSATQTASTLLWTDVTAGLQLTVRTSGGAVLYSGPLSGLGYLAGPTTLAPGTTELLRYTFDFPASATNALQGLIQDLTLVFDAVEFP